MRTVAVKSAQQAVLGLHRVRTQLAKFRTMQIYQLRSLLYEFGVTLRTGGQAGTANERITKGGAYRTTC